MRDETSLHSQRSGVVRDDRANASIDSGLRAYMNRVYGLMATATAVCAGTAWAFAANDALFALMRDPATLQPTLLGWIVVFAPLAMVLFFGSIVTRLSPAAARGFFYFYAATIGASLSYLAHVYTGASIVQTFLSTTIGFAGLSLWGYTTRRDLSGFGSFMVMGLFGLVGATLLNLFLRSPGLDFAISVVGILVFAGLTAWDTQKIKTIYLELRRTADAETIEKSAIFGALSLFLDFLNLFLFLLRFMGASRNN